MDVHSRHLLAHGRLHARRALIALVAALALPAAAAAQGVAVEVTPLRVELKTGPGGSYTQAVKLTNQGKEAVRIHARVDEWYLSKDGTPQFKLTSPGTGFSSAAWMRLNPVEVVVQPGADATVRFTVTVPAGTPEGGYRAAIMFDFSPPNTDVLAASRGVAFRSRVATLIYLTVGTPKPAVDLTDVQPRLLAGQPPAVVATLKNTGRVQVRTKGQLLVYNQANALVRRLSLPDVPVLPESERDVLVPLGDEQQAALPAGKYRLELRIDVGLPEVLVGETTITIGH